jgi:carbon monoxide dehydrogenase subunit G
MFTIKAGYSDTIELRSGIDQVREFFADLQNFVEMMPGISQIHIDAKGLAHWTIKAEIPVVGSIIQKFAVELAESTEDRVEWAPVAAEKQNYLRYAADFLEKAENLTIVKFAQGVELRRKSPRELHLLAGLAGEGFINKELSRRVTEMIRIFIRKAKEKLEK